MAIAKRKLAEPVRVDIKKEDTVKVITGRDKGKQGRVLSVNRDTGKILVEHVMMIKRVPTRASRSRAASPSARARSRHPTSCWCARAATKRYGWPTTSTM